MPEETGGLPVEGITPEVKVEPNPEVEQLKSELTKHQQNLSSAQGVTKKQAQEIQTLRDQINQAESQRDTYMALVGLVAKQTNQTPEQVEETVQARKPDLVVEAKRIIQETENSRRIRQFQDKFNSYAPIVLNELGLKEGDENFDIINAFASAGKWDKADAAIERVRKSKTQVPEVKKEDKKVETEDERIERLVEERLRKQLDAKGLTKQETGSPSASSRKFDEIEKGYTEGTVPYEVYAKARKELNL